MGKPTYFLTPLRPYPPSGPIRLGAIIQSPKIPDEPLYHPDQPDESDISKFYEQNWTGSHVLKSSSRFGVWTSFCEMLVGAGIDISVIKDYDLKENWKVQNMCTMSFVPTRAYIERSVAHEDVTSYIVDNRFRDKIYMITGVMIASGSTVFREALEEKGVYVHAGVDATAWAGVPVSMGPEGKWKKKEVVRESSTREEDYVFAFRIHEIRVRRKGGVKSHRHFDKGALFNLEKQRATGGEVESVDVEDLIEEEEIGETFDMEVKECVNEDEVESEQCICVIPELEGF